MYPNQFYCFACITVYFFLPVWKIVIPSLSENFFLHFVSVRFKMIKFIKFELYQQKLWCFLINISYENHKTHFVFWGKYEDNSKMLGELPFNMFSSKVTEIYRELRHFHFCWLYRNVQANMLRHLNRYI